MQVIGRKAHPPTSLNGWVGCQNDAVCESSCLTDNLGFPRMQAVSAEVLRCLHIGHASILDQAHGLKLELPRELPSLHDPPPAPSKHLTRCLRNRVQAISLYPSAGLVETRRRSHLLACSVYPLLTLTALAASAQQQVSLAVLLHPLEHHVQAVA